VKRVLIVSYYYPPSGGAGVQRALKFAKYLPEFGWEPVVLTVREDADFPARDPSLLAEASGIEVVRTSIFEPYSLYRKFTGKQSDEPTDIANLNPHQRQSLASRFSEFVRATFFIPDARCFWKGPAVREGLRLLSEGDFDLIFSTAPPYTTHLVARALHKKTGLPWVADFRDSWVGWLSAPKRWAVPHRIDLTLEGGVLADADRLVAVTAGVRDDLSGRHAVDPDKWSLIPNGYDAVDFEGIEAAPPKDRFVLTYTGSLYGKRHPGALLSALTELFAENPAMRGRFRLSFVGRVDPSFAEAFTAFGDVIEYAGYVPHQESIRRLLSSTALLLIVDDSPASRGIVTGKLFEYLGSGRPILALAPEGEAADLIRRTRSGLTAPPNDPAAVKAALLELYSRWERGELLTNRGESIAGFERKRLTGELARVFDGILEKKNPAD
jgi:glycosyltransferase involved in cell wall biosynthesis